MVSVIVPTYNRRGFIRETIDSVLGQTYSDLELIVVDDGSTDGTRDLILELYGSEKRVRYVHQHNQERSFARNRGIIEAKGEFVAFLDSDDLWLADKLQRQVIAIERSEDIDMVVTWWEIVDVDCNPVRAVTNPAIADVEAGLMGPMMAYENLIGSPTPLIRRRALDGICHFNPNLIGVEDWEFWARVSLRGKVALIPEVLARYRLHKGNTGVAVRLRLYLNIMKSVKRGLSKSQWEPCKPWVRKWVREYLRNEKGLFLGGSFRELLHRHWPFFP